MTAKERDRRIKHWENVISKLHKIADKRGYSLDSERQERYLAEHKIEEIRASWSGLRS